MTRRQEGGISGLWVAHRLHKGGRVAGMVARLDGGVVVAVGGRGWSTTLLLPSQDTSDEASYGVHRRRREVEGGARSGGVGM